MHNILFLQNLGAGEIIIIALVILLLFGGKKIPELMRGLGKGVKEFKNGMDEVKRDLDTDSEAAKKDKVLEPDKIEKTK